MSPITGPCEWMEGCLEEGKLYGYKNPLGDEVRHFYCDRHVAMLKSPEQTEEMLHRLYKTKQVVEGMSGRPLDHRALLRHPAQMALSLHQDSCQQCREVREWISREQLAGRITTTKDIHRLGAYVITHCCPMGILLNEAVGKAMAGQ